LERTTRQSGGQGASFALDRVTAGAVARREEVQPAPPVLDVDARRRALEARIEHAKEALAVDLARVRAAVRRLSTGAKKSAVRVAIVGTGFLLLGVFAAFAWRVARARRR
jgi:hypothetical protein